MSAENSFLFCLIRKKTYLLDKNYHSAILCHSAYGPTFGYCGYDLTIASNKRSISKLKCSYASEDNTVRQYDLNGGVDCFQVDRHYGSFQNCMKKF